MFHRRPVICSAAAPISASPVLNRRRGRRVVRRRSLGDRPIFDRRQPRHQCDLVRDEYDDVTFGFLCVPRGRFTSTDRLFNISFFSKIHFDRLDVNILMKLLPPVALEKLHISTFGSVQIGRSVRPQIHENAAAPSSAGAKN
jgi:hypothetical protein